MKSSETAVSSTLWRRGLFFSATKGTPGTSSSPAMKCGLSMEMATGVRRYPLRRYVGSRKRIELLVVSAQRRVPISGDTRRLWKAAAFATSNGIVAGTKGDGLDQD